jgi:dephospho-CoA kinase
MKKENNARKFPKLLIISNMRWGKDTFAEILRDNFGLKFISSSQAAADIFIYKALKDKYGYKTSEECFNDRVNHRAEWYNLICDYNKDDKARLAKGILELADCYVGMRDRGEIEECMKQGLFDLIVWIDSSKRLAPEPPDSFNIDQSCADIIVNNNGTLEQFRERVIRIGKVFKKTNGTLKERVIRKIRKVFKKI